MPPTPNSLMMWYRGPNVCPTLSGPVAAWEGVSRLMALVHALVTVSPLVMPNSAPGPILVTLRSAPISAPSPILVTVRPAVTSTVTSPVRPPAMVPRVAPSGSPVVSVAMTSVATPINAKAAPHAEQRPASTDTEWPQRGQTIKLYGDVADDYGATRPACQARSPGRAPKREKVFSAQ